MKNIIPLVTLLALSHTTQAQHPLSQNDICPNWTLTDITGVEHDLYTYLDAGYSVVFYVGSTSSMNTWSVHQDQVLRDLYASHGLGSPWSDIMVFMIEGNATTDSDDLAGTGNQTVGDWITDTPYPIIDNGEALAEVMHYEAFPYICCVSPNRQIFSTVIFQTAAEMVTAAYYSRDRYLADTPNDPALIFTSDYNYCLGPQPSVSVRLQNVGTSPLTSASIETALYMEPLGGPIAIDTLEWTGYLDTYDYIDLVTTQLIVPVGMHNYRVRLLDQNDLVTNDEYVASARASAVVPSTSISMELLTDSAGWLAWWLYREGLPNPLYSAAGTLNNTLYTEEWELVDNACYRFIITHQNIAGLGEPGYFHLFSGGTQFAAESAMTQGVQIVEFRIEPQVGIQSESEQTELAISPNPMDEHVSIDLRKTPGLVHIQFVDASGRVVRKETVSGGWSVQLQRANLASGLYSLVAIGNNGLTQHAKLIVR